MDIRGAPVTACPLLYWNLRILKRQGEAASFYRNSVTYHPGKNRTTAHLVYTVWAFIEINF